MRGSTCSDGQKSWPPLGSSCGQERAFLLSAYGQFSMAANMHALRHTYVTNLIEWGYSEKFVQDQVGHAYASTTAIYTSLGDDYKTRMVTRALARIYGGNDADNR